LDEFVAWSAKLYPHLALARGLSSPSTEERSFIVRLDPSGGQAARLNSRLVELARERSRFGYRRLHVLLRREGHVVNHKKVLRLYRLAGLNLRRQKRKRMLSLARGAAALPTRPNECWALDFVSDTLAWGRSSEWPASRPRRS